MKIRRIRNAAVLAFTAIWSWISAVESVQGAEIVWVNASDGAWSNPANWSPNQVPGAADTVTITGSGTYTVTADTGVTVAGLTLGGATGTQTLVVTSTFTLDGPGTVNTRGVFTLQSGTLNGRGQLSVAGAFNWTGGTMSGTGSTMIEAGATLAISGTNGKAFIQRTLTNDGTISWAGTGGVGSGGGGTVNNRGVFNIQSDVSWFNQFGGELVQFNNTGTLRRSAGSGLVEMSQVFINNTGVIEVQTGALRFGSGSSSSASITVSSGASMEWANGTHDLTGTSTVSGAGNAQIVSGTLNVAGNWNLTGAMTVGGTANFNATGPMTASAVNITGTAVFNSAVTTPSLNLASGALSGTGLFTVTGTSSWTGGIFSGTGQTVIGELATLLIQGSNNKAFMQRTLVNKGTILWSGTGSMGSGNGGMFNNEGRFEIQSDVSWFNQFGGPPSLLMNTGTMLRTVGTGLVDLNNIGVRNSGAIEVQTGALRLSIGEVLGGLTTISNGASLEFASGTHIVPAAASLRGVGGNVTVHSGTLIVRGNLTTTGAVTVHGGTVQLSPLTTTFNPSAIVMNGGTANFNVTTTTPTLSFTGGTLSGTGSMTVSGTMNWTGGHLTGLSALTIPTGAAVLISGSNGKSFSQRTLNNSGTLTWSGTGGMGVGLGGVINNQGTFELQSDVTWHQVYSGDPTVFNNTGIFRKINAIGTTDFSYLQMNNRGSVDVQNGTLRLGQGGVSSGSFTVGTGATIDFSGGTHRLLASSSLTGNGGNLTVSGGTLILRGALGITGTIYMIGGNADLSSVGAMHPSGLVLSGGTIGLSPGTGGLNPSAITISGAAAYFEAATTADSLNLSGGLLAGSGTVTVNTTMTWTGGSVGGTGVLNIGTGATLALSGSNTRYFYERTLNNSGVVTWSGTGAIGAGLGGIINNSGVFEVQSDVPWYQQFSGDPTTFNNSGTLRKVSGSGTADWSYLTLNNTGTVQIQSGTLRFGQGGLSSGGFALSSGATLELSGGTHRLTEASSVTGAGGNLAITGGTVQLRGTMTATGSISMSNGTADLSPTGGLSPGAIVISGGTISLNPATGTMSPATVTISGGNAYLEGTTSVGTLNLSGGGLLGRGAVTVNSAMTWTGGSVGGSGILEIGMPATVAISGSNGKAIYQRTLNNNGTMTWSGSGGISAGLGGVFNNAGTFDIQSDATWYAGFSGDPTLINNSGTIRRTTSIGTAGLDFVALKNNGSIDVQTGSLRIGGNYSAGAASTHSVRLGGITAGSQYSQLHLPGTATLAGTLNIGLANGFVPSVGDVFNVVTYGSVVGKYSTVTGLSVSGSVSLVPNYSGTALSLSGMSAPVNTAPVITRISNQSTAMGVATAAVPFSISDAEAAATALTVSGSSSDATLVPVANIVFAGTGADRTVTVTPASGQVGTATITVTVSDGTLSAVASFTLTVVGAEVAWTNAAGGNWNVGSNWSTGAVPAAGDRVVISAAGTYTITLDVDATMAGLILGGSSGVQTLVVNGRTLTVSGQSVVQANGILQHDGGTLAGGGTLTVAGVYNWTGGTQSGDGILSIAAGGRLAITGGNGKAFLQRTLVNAGLITWSGATIGSGNGGVISNSGVFELQGDGFWSNHYGGAPVVLNNTGTLRRTTSVGTTGFDFAVLNNSGTVDVQTGRLRFGSGGTSSGTFTLSSDTTLEFNGGSHFLAASSSVTGTGGHFVMSGGQANFNGTFSSTGSISVIGGTATFTPVAAMNPNAISVSGGLAVIAPAAGSLSPNTITLNGGTLELGVATTTQTLSHSNGTLTGAGALTVNGSSSWNGGIWMGRGSVTISTSGTLSMGGGDRNFLQRTLNNNGTIVWSGGRMGSGGGGVINNSGTFEIQSDIHWFNQYGGDPVVLNNSGTLKRTTSTGAAMLDYLVVNSTGTVAVQSGVLRFGAGGLGSGPHTVTSGATLEFNGGAYVLTGASSVTGAGGNLTVSGASVYLNGTFGLTGTVTVTGGLGQLTPSGAMNPSSIAVSGGTAVFKPGTGSLSPGTITISGGAAVFDVAVTTANLTLNNGALTGSGGVTVNGSSSWNGGSISGLGSLTIGSLGTLAVGGGDKSFLQRTLNNNGTIIWSGGRIGAGGGGVINNVGMFEIQNDAHWFNQFGGDIPLLINSGTLKKTTSTGVANLEFLWVNSSGNINVQSGSLRLGGGGLGSGAYSISNGATLEFSGGIHVLSSTSAISGAGGNLTINGANLHTTGTLSASGQLAVTAGLAHLTPSGAMNPAAISVFGGTLFLEPATGTLNPATVTIGGGAAVFNVDTTTGVLNFSGGMLTGAANVTANGTSSWNGGMLNGLGALTIGTAGTLSIGGQDKSFLHRTLNNHGTIIWNGGRMGSGGGGTVNNLGVLEIQADIHWFNQFGGDPTAFNNSGTLKRTSSPGTAFLENVIFKNTGTISMLSGILRVGGDYLPRPSSNHRFTLGGVAAGTQFGQLQISGGTTLDGTVDVVLANNFVPAVGNTFAVMTFGSQSGVFSLINGLAVSPGVNLTPRYNSTAFVLEAGNTPGNTPPTVSVISDQVTSVGVPTGAIAFVVGDAEVAATSLVVTGTSSNPTLVPNTSAGIAFAGTAANRTVTLTPSAGQTGTSTIQINVSDGVSSTTAAFVLTVTGANSAPTISAIANQSTRMSESVGPIAFTISDAETLVGNLSVTGFSSNQALVPNGNIAIAGGSSTRTVTVTPAPNQTGTVTIELVVSDGNLSARTSFTLSVSGSAPVLNGIETTTLHYVANSAPLALTATLAASDSDSVNLAGGIIRIISGFAAGQDVLTFVNRDGITGSYNGASGVLTLSGSAPVSAYQGALRSVTYQNQAAEAVGGPRTIEFVVNDGAAGSDSVFPVTRQLMVAVNAPPSINAQSFEVIENALSGAFVGQLAAADPNPGTALTFSVVSGAEGKFVINSSGAISVAGLLDYEQKRDYVLGISVTDNGQPAKSASANVNITILNVDEGPGMDPLPVLPAILEDAGSQTFVLTGVSPGDRDPATLTVSVAVDNPALIASSEVLISETGVRSVRFSPAPNAHGSGNLTVTVRAGVDAAIRTFSRSTRLEVKPVIDGAPQVTGASTVLNQQATGLIIRRSSLDGPEVSHFQVSNISGGTLYRPDGLSSILNGEYITAEEGLAGLRFTPAFNSIAPGTFQVKASLRADDTGLGGESSGATIVITQADQQIAFGPIAARMFGDPPLNLQANASSQLPVQFEIAFGSASISGNVLSVLSAGTVGVRAVQSGNSLYRAAQPVTQFFQVLKAGQTISFGPVPSKIYGDAAFPLSAVASSGLATQLHVEFGPGELTVDNKLNVFGVGTVLVTATQPGNQNYLPASPVSQVVQINPAPLNIAIGNVSRPFGHPNPALSGTITGLKNGDLIQVEYVCVATANSRPGKYPITARIKDLANKLGNYTVSITAGELTIQENAIPVASPLTVLADEDRAKPISLTGTDAEGAALSFVIVTPPQNGSLSGIPPQVSYMPKPDFNGSDSFTFRVSDGFAESAPAAVSITVGPVNDPPALDLIPTIALKADGPTVTIPLTGIKPGPAGEQAQPIALGAESSAPGIVTIPAGGLSYSSPNSTGALTLQPVAGAVGEAMITVTADDGQAGNNITTRTFRAQVTRRLVQVGVVDGMTGSEVLVRVRLTAQGNENSLALSLSVDEVNLVFNSVELGVGAAGATLVVNAEQPVAPSAEIPVEEILKERRIGILISLPAGQVFGAGIQEIALLRLRVTDQAAEGPHAVEVVNSPVVSEVTDVEANRVPAVFESGAVVVKYGLEADVAPRPEGSTPGMVSMTDWTQVGRFAAHLDEVSSSGEFRRADCAPRLENGQLVLGNGLLSVGDWVQAGRYAAGMDLPVNAGGPFGIGGTPFEVRAVPLLGGLSRAMGMKPQPRKPGGAVRLPVVVEARGDENAFGFSVEFDPDVLRFRSHNPSKALIGATLLANPTEALRGRIGFMLALGVGEVLSPGKQELIELEFDLVEPAEMGATSVFFGDFPVRREVVSAGAETLAARYVRAEVQLNSTEPEVSLVRRANGLLSVRIKGEQGKEYLVEVSNNLTDWTAVKALRLEGDELEWTEAAPSNESMQRFYRVRVAP